MSNRVTVTSYQTWAPLTHEDYAFTALALYAIAATVAVIGVGMWAIVRGRGR